MDGIFRVPRIVLLTTLIGLGVRFALAPFTGHPWDMRIWLDVGQRTLELHQNIYEIGSQMRWVWGYYAYPPAWLGWLAVAYYFSWNPFVYALVLKLPMILADLATGLVVFKFVTRLMPRDDAAKAFAFYFLNPLLILIGSVWGMFDSIAVLATTLSLYWLTRGKLPRSALALGVGILVKIYPVMLLPMILFGLRYKRHATSTSLIVYASLSALPAAIFSVPFLAQDWRSYVNALLIHGSPSGWLTYWLFLTKVSIVFVQYAPLAFIVLFALAYLALVLKARSLHEWTVDEFVLLSISILVSFMITSPKVSVQYFLWMLPLLTVHGFAARSRLSRQLSFAVTTLGVGLVVASMPVNRFLILGLNVPVEAWLVASSATSIIVISAVTPFTFFSYLTSHFAGRDRLFQFHARRSIAAGLAIILIVIAISPFPISARAGNASFLVAMPESPASGFDPLAKDFGVPEFLAKFQSRAVVLLFGPDFANTYEGYKPQTRVTDFFKVRYYDDWTLGNIQELVKALHSRGVSVHLGLSLRAIQIVGTKGYSSRWLTESHPEVLNEEFVQVSKSLKPDSRWGIVEATTYGRYLTARASRIMTDLEFDGLLLSEIPSISSRENFMAFAEISKAVRANGKSAFISFSGVPDPRTLGELLAAFDFVIVSTSPWRDGVFFPNPNIRIDRYSRILQSSRAFLQPEESRRLLGVLELMDEQQGWVVPFSYFMIEENARSSWGLSGYIIEFANKYSPYSVRAS